MNSNTEIVIECNQPNCLARGVGHDTFWSQDEDDRNAVSHEHWRSGIVAVQRNSWDENGWFVYVDDMADPEFTPGEARELAAEIIHAAQLVETLNAPLALATA
jgi:hypothetical protein